MPVCTICKKWYDGTSKCPTCPAGLMNKLPCDCIGHILPFYANSFKDMSKFRKVSKDFNVAASKLQNSRIPGYELIYHYFHKLIHVRTLQHKNRQNTPIQWITNIADNRILILYENDSIVIYDLKTKRSNKFDFSFNITKYSTCKGGMLKGGAPFLVINHVLQGISIRPKTVILYFDPETLKSKAYVCEKNFNDFIVMPDSSIIAKDSGFEGLIYSYDESAGEHRHSNTQPPKIPYDDIVCWTALSNGDIAFATTKQDIYWWNSDCELFQWSSKHNFTVRRIKYKNTIRHLVTFKGLVVSYDDASEIRVWNFFAANQASRKLARLPYFCGFAMMKDSFIAADRGGKLLLFDLTDNEYHKKHPGIPGEFGCTIL